MSMGLRAKSALALLACIAAVLVLALFVGWRALAAIEENLGVAFARNFTQYNEQRLLAPVLRELALSQRLADSEVSRRWLNDETSQARKALFFAEATNYQKAFADRSYFIISARTNHYYFNDRSSKWSDRPRYTLNPRDPDDAWFFSTIRNLKPATAANSKNYNINVNIDSKLKVTKVWFNVLVSDGARKLGLAGTGLDLTTVLEHFLKSGQSGITPMVVNTAGAIQAHPDKSLINYDSVSGSKATRTIYQLLTREAERAALKSALARATRNENAIETLNLHLDGRTQLVALSYAPELQWHILTAVDLRAARVLDRRLWLPLLLGASLLVVVLLAALTFVFNRILLAPLLRLTRSVRAMAGGDYDAPLPPASGDELGELTRAFGAMASQVKSYTEELESKVEERTRELVQANREVEAAHKSIGDSIEYAGLIQNAILPRRELEQLLGNEYFIWWKPRDVVGGDLYIFRAGEGENQGNFLIGVLDCAGHGVPGALMTMMAHSIIHTIIDRTGIENPAEILNIADVRLRSTLQSAVGAERLATHMDAGLCYVDLKAQTVTFAGAKTSLYWSQSDAEESVGGEVEIGQAKGDRAALGDRRETLFTNQTLPLQNRTWYLTTDGVLDQSGGDRGFSFGSERFAQMLKRYAHATPAAQREAFERELMEYRNGRAQRDDITLIGFGLKRLGLKQSRTKTTLLDGSNS